MMRGEAIKETRIVSLPRAINKVKSKWKNHLGTQEMIPLTLDDFPGRKHQG